MDAAREKHLHDLAEIERQRYGLLPKSGWEPQLIRSPVKLAQRRAGDMAIVHRTIPKGTKVDIVSIREALLSGTTPAHTVLPEPLVVHELRQVSGSGQGVWMSDMPCELNQMAEGIHEAQPQGSVLVGGLGLGILPGMLRDYRAVLNVSHITVVERNENVADLCQQEGYDVVVDDIAAYLRDCQPFDCFMLDTWTGQSEHEWWRIVMPLRRIVRNRFGGARLWCWKEREMWGQVYRTLRGPGPHWICKDLPTPMSHQQALDFLQGVGTPEWEGRYGKFFTQPKGERR